MAETVPREMKDPAETAPLVTTGGAHGVPEVVRPPSSNFRFYLLIAGVIVLIAAIATWRHYSQRESTDDAQIDGHLNPISARVSGYVQRVNVDDNQAVEAGAVLVEIDPKDYQVAYDKAKADYDDAVAAADAARVGVPITSASTSSQLASSHADVQDAQAGVIAAARQLEATQARLQAAEANQTKAISDLERYKQLIAKQEISQQQYDQAIQAAQTTAANVAEARASLAASQQQVIQSKQHLAQSQAGLESAQTAPQQVAATRSRYTSAAANAEKLKAALDQAALNLTYTKIIAPVRGVVGKKSVEVGQNVQVGQELMSVVALDDIWVTANFKETQLERMAPGLPVTISVDAFSRDYKGHILSIGAASGSRFSLLPPENATGNYVKVVQRIPVKIVFESGENRDHLLRPGMSVTPTVKLK